MGRANRAADAGTATEADNEKTGTGCEEGGKGLLKNKLSKLTLCK